MLFVAKVLYLLESDSEDKQNEIKEMEEQTLRDGMVRKEVELEAGADEVESDNEAVKDEHSKPATLLWLIQKLSRIAKLEAAYSPRNPLKVPVHVQADQK